MADNDLKKRLLQMLVAAQDRERELENLCDDARPDPGQWTAKDHIAHLAHWRRHAAQVLNAARTGAPAPNAEDVDAVNADVEAANRDRPAEAVKDDARASYAELARAIDDCSDEDLMKPRPGRESAKVLEVVPGNGHLHVGEHLGFWYEAHGDHRGAEQAQLWTLEVHEAAFTDAKSRSFGAYNLGCYYARHGRAAEALPHLKHSLELNPELKEWARSDEDLDPVRNDPQVQAILV
jgi:tetratricopeptide (TPR) repeat protein